MSYVSREIYTGHVIVPFLLLCAVIVTLPNETGSTPLRLWYRSWK